MVGAMVVLLALIAVFVVFRAVNRTEPESAVRSIDYQPVVAAARDQVDFPVMAPPELPAGWRATVAQFTVTPPSWHLRVLTEEQRYLGLEQARSSVRDMVMTYVDREAVRGRTVEVDGETWRLWTDAGGDTALVRTDQKLTTLVVTTGDVELLTRYLGLLREQPPSA